MVSDGKVLVRYMYEHDTSTPEKHHETYKPYLHVFDTEGKKPITKGAGGQFTHHRGIFIGWSKTKANGKSYDRWHMKGGDIVHQKFLKQEVQGRHGGFHLGDPLDGRIRQAVYGGGKNLYGFGRESMAGG